MFCGLRSRVTCIMTSLDTVPLDVDFGHFLTGSNYSDRSRVGGGVGDVDEDDDEDDDEGDEGFVPVGRSVRGPSLSSYIASLATGWFFGTISI